MIGLWHHPVVRLFVRLSVCDAVHSGSQGWCTRCHNVKCSHKRAVERSTKVAAVCLSDLYYIHY